MKDTKYTVDRLAKLHPKARAGFQAFIEAAESRDNCTYRISQGLRTFAEQDALYNQPHDHKDNDHDGKIDEPDEKVTNCKGGQSYHNYGLAIDLVKLKANGDVDWKADYKSLQALAAKYGITWGGIFKDWDHFEMNFGHGPSGWPFFRALHDAGKVDTEGYVLF